MKTYYVLGFCMIMAALYTLRPVDYQDDSLNVDVSGIVERVHTPCCGDVNISLSGDDRMFYLNRALFQDKNIQEWKSDLEGEQIQLKGVAHSSILNPRSQWVPVKLLVKDDEIMYSVNRVTTSL